MPRISTKFEIRGIEPSGDPAWQAADESVKRAFWRAVVAFGLKAKDAELAAGLDRYGSPLKPVSAATRKHRKSEMGPADPSAPPLMPSYGTSRTRLNLTGRGFADHAEFYWTDNWGKILRYHAEGRGRYGKIPKRNVIGISPDSMRKVRGWSLGWWLTHKRTKSLELARKPLRPERVFAGALPVTGRTDFESFTYGIGGGSAQRSRELLAAGKTTGFRQFAPPGGFEAEGPLTSSPFFKPKPKPRTPADRLDEAKARRNAEFAAKVKAAGEKAEREAKVKAMTKAEEAGALPIQIKGAVSEWIQEQSRRVLRDLPEHVRRTIKAHGARVIVGRTMADAAPEVAREKPRGWKAGETFANADGCYRRDTKEIITTEARRDSATGRDVLTGRAPGVLRHETGHAFDAALKDRSHRRDFQEAHAEDAAKMEDAARAEFGYYLQAGHAGPEEAFAELFGQLLGGGCDWNDLAAIFPRCTAIVKGLL